MRRISSGKSQEELQSDVLCLKRQLALALDENQLLKVKIRRLEDELRRKDKYIECAHSDPQKSRQFGKFAHEAANSLIYKLRRRNEELEDMLLEKDSQENKRYKDFKTMCIYSSNTDFQSNKKGLKPLLPHDARSNSRLRSNTASLKALNKVNSSVIRGRVRSSDSLSDNVTARRNTNNGYVSIDTADISDLERYMGKDSEICNVLETLEMENIISDRLLSMKNAEICRLTAELEDIKNRLRQQECGRLHQSTSSTQHDEILQTQDQGTGYVCTDFVEDNKKPVIRSRAKYNNNLRGHDHSTCKYPVNQKLATLYEHSEETSSLDKTMDSPFNVPNNGDDRGMIVKPQTRTRIEYVDDSEVSSDGEEFTLPSNLTNFLAQAVSKGSSEDGMDFNSD